MRYLVLDSKIYRIFIVLQYNILRETLKNYILQNRLKMSKKREENKSIVSHLPDGIFRELFESDIDPIVIMDKNHIAIYINKSFE